MGKSGISAFKFLKKKGGEVIAVSKGSPLTWNLPDDLEKYSESSFYDEEIFLKKNKKLDVDYLILAPGISKKHPLVQMALSQRVKVWSEIELAYHFCLGKIIAITGTNGKTTSATLCAHLIKAAGKKVFLGGNIGTPFCEFTEDVSREDYVVLELSSFQLESIEDFHPQAAVILNLTPAHGERYETPEDYYSAKKNIYKNMIEGDLLVVTPLIQKEEIKIRFVEIISDATSENFNELSLENFSMYGAHNKINLWCVLKILNFFHLNNLQKGIDSFPPVPHRLEKINTFLSCPAYNDAKSTNWQSTLTALEGLNHKEVWLILGGKKRGRGDSIRPYLSVIKKYVKKVFLIGETSDDLALEIQNELVFEKSYTLKQALESIKIGKPTLDNCLLFSPAFPSFDQYQSYEERGLEFKKNLFA